MKEIQRKAQIEATEATKQLEDARKRASEAAINAADMIAKVIASKNSKLLSKGIITLVFFIRPFVSRYTSV